MRFKLFAQQHHKKFLAMGHNIVRCIESRMGLSERQREFVHILQIAKLYAVKSYSVSLTKFYLFKVKFT